MSDVELHHKCPGKSELNDWEERRQQQLLAVEQFNNSVSSSNDELANKYREELLQDIQELYEYYKKLNKAMVDKNEAEEKERQWKAKMTKINEELDELKKDKMVNREKIAEMENEFARAKEESAKAKNEAERAKRNLESANADLEQVKKRKNL